MPPSSPHIRVERARPLLGTRVAIRCDAPNAQQANAAIDAAFDAIAQIHALMSFQDAASDVSRLNREASQNPVQVHPHTYRVLKCAQQLAADSDGVFDVSVAGQLCAWGLLPEIAGAPRASETASWRDIDLLDGRHVHFRQPLCIDLSGIAKGYAVDSAIAALQNAGIAEACVNAGGDLRLIGADRERIALRSCRSDDTHAPMLELDNAAVASSCGYPQRQLHQGRWLGPHLRGDRREPVDPEISASVIAPQCMLADALTKLVLADATLAAALLSQHEALAYRHHPAHGWQAIGDTPPPIILH
ncbi:MAG: FAD:protein FMN transferase [Stenotrophobium sp.]